MVNKNLYFILSASCKLVRGLKRCVIIDYDRGNLYFITHEYLTLMENMDRKQLKHIEKEIDNDSRDFFEEFLAMIIANEIGFFTKNQANFPKIEDGLNNDNVLLKDVIIEIDEFFFNKINFKNLCLDLIELRCKYFEIRILSKLDLYFLDEVIKIINTTYSKCVEIHCTYNDDIDITLLQNFIEEQSLVSKMFVYGSPENRIVEVLNYSPNPHVQLGNIYFLNYTFDNGNCCGIINKENLHYSKLYLHNLLKTRNGCLDRKISIDKNGNIKNCPSMKKEFGNIREVSIKDVLQDDEFKKYWSINKDNISICKACEFRYNCTDCRAFLQKADDIYSKPLKCGYDPNTCKWEDWSTSSLTKKDIMNISTK